MGVEVKEWRTVCEEPQENIGKTGAGHAIKNLERNLDLRGRVPPREGRVECREETELRCSRTASGLPLLVLKAATGEFVEITAQQVEVAWVTFRIISTQITAR